MDNHMTINGQVVHIASVLEALAQWVRESGAGASSTSYTMISNKNGFPEEITISCKPLEVAGSLHFP